jgi:hypothetical protein
MTPSTQESLMPFTYTIKVVPFYRYSDMVWLKIYRTYLGFINIEAHSEGFGIKEVARTFNNLNTREAIETYLEAKAGPKPLCKVIE